MVRNSCDSATLEELPVEPTAKADNNYERPKPSKKGRLELSQRHPDLVRAKQYNMLEKKDDNMINDWKSYPGLALIIAMAREILDTGKTTEEKKFSWVFDHIPVKSAEP